MCNVPSAPPATLPAPQQLAGLNCEMPFSLADA